MSWCRINNDGTIQSIETENPDGRFHPDIKFVEVPENIKFLIDMSFTYNGSEFVPPSLNYIKNKFKDSLATTRYIKEIEGIVVNGNKVSTTRESQAMINGAYSAIQLNPDAQIQFKTDGNFVTMNATSITEIATDVSNHVQACFASEKQVVDNIESVLTLDELLALNMSEMFDNIFSLNI